MPPALTPVIDLQPSSEHRTDTAAAANSDLTNIRRASVGFDIHHL
jgi:hypothetical protein